MRLATGSTFARKNGFSDHDGCDPNALQAFHKNHQIAIGHLDGLVELGHRADAMEVDLGRVLHARIELCDHGQETVFALQEN